MPEPTNDTLALIAGSGSFPCDIAKSAMHRGTKVVVIAFRGHADARLAELADSVAWVHPGEVAAALDALRASGARRAVMAGKIPKSILFAEGVGAAKLDTVASRGLAGLEGFSDDAVLGLVADQIAKIGVELVSQLDLVPELVGGVGALGRVAFSASQRNDVEFAWPIAKAIAGLDIGQTVVVRDGAVLAIEAIEGTDEAIRRAGSFAAGGRVVKVAKPHQDPRFDVPAIGSETVRAMIDAGAEALAIEAGRTLVLERTQLIEIANENGITLVGIEPGATAREAA